MLQSIMNISHDCAQQSFTVVKTNFLVLGSITVMLQSIVYIVHDCANQIIMVVLQSSLHTVIELVNQRAALLIVLEKDKGSSRSVWFVHRQRPATWHPCAGIRKIEILLNWHLFWTQAVPYQIL